MSHSFFISGYQVLHEQLGRRVIMPYIENAARQLNTASMDDEILKVVFKKLSTGHVNKMDISADEIRRLYWHHYFAEKGLNRGGTNQGECPEKLCDGFGYITLEKIPTHYSDGSKIDRSYSIKVDYLYRCTCYLGKPISEEIPLYRPSLLDKGYSLKWDIKKLKENEYLGKKQVEIDNGLKLF